MSRHLIIIPFMVLVIRLVAVEAGRYSPDEPAYDHDATIGAMLLTEDPETLLAFSRRLRFSQTGIYELELVPRISDTLAFRVDDLHESISTQAKKLPVERAYQAFELVKGIGPETSSKLGKYIEVSR